MRVSSSYREEQKINDSNQQIEMRLEQKISEVTSSYRVE
jgi:hypothetical protein